MMMDSRFRYVERSSGFTSDLKIRRMIAPACLVLITCLVLALAGCASTRGDADLTNTITWSTASESDNFGYDVYRSENRDGPFVRITSQPVLGAGTTDVPNDYRFVDRSIETGKAYFYYVESISMSGRRKPFTPVMKSRAKGDSP